MVNNLKRGRLYIFILLVSLVLPFNVWAKQNNTFVMDFMFSYEELISGDTIRFDGTLAYVPVENQNFTFTNEDNVINIEYYIIDSIDSDGNITYKKYDFSNLDKNVWHPESSALFDYSGFDYDYSSDKIEYFDSCKMIDRESDRTFSTDAYGQCNILLPSVDGKIARWRFDTKDYGDVKNIDVCSYSKSNYNTVYTSCDKAEGQKDNTYIGRYDYYTSYTYKFYQLPDDQPNLKITCDNNKLAAGETTECSINLSFKYGLNSILFDITSDKLKMDNLWFSRFVDSWYWSFKDTDNGYSLSYAPYNRTAGFENDPVVATFDVTADEDIDDVVGLLNTSDIKYVEKPGEGIVSKQSVSDDEIISDGENTSGNETDNITNPNTFRNSYYMLIGLIIVGLIGFIQLRSRYKSEELKNHIQ